VLGLPGQHEIKYSASILGERKFSPSWKCLFPKSIHSVRGWLIASRIAELRSQNGFTQRDLARLLAREHGLVSRIETCERRVELVELIQILTAIGCDVEFEIGRLVADLLKISTPDEPDSRKLGS
jgi:Helix-turn-helix domain